MRRYGLVFLALLWPIGALLCGGRSMLSDRVTALEAEVESINAALADHERRIAALEGDGARLVVLDATGAVVGDVVPGTATDLGAFASRPSGVYPVAESGFSPSRSLIFRDSSCTGPVFTVDLDWPTENGTSFFPVERPPVVNGDLKARLRADASVADDEGLSTVQLYIPDGQGGCQAWGPTGYTFNAAAVWRLIERDDLSSFVTPFRIVKQ